MKVLIVDCDCYNGNYVVVETESNKVEDLPGDVWHIGKTVTEHAEENGMDIIACGHLFDPEKVVPTIEEATELAKAIGIEFDTICDIS